MVEAAIKFLHNDDDSIVFLQVCFLFIVNPYVRIIQSIMIIVNSNYANDWVNIKCQD